MMSDLSNRAKGAPITLYSDGRAYVRLHNKYNTLCSLIKVTPEKKLIVASEFSIGAEPQRHKIDAELLYTWFVSAASSGRAFAYMLIWTQLCSNEKYCAPAYSEEFSKDALDNLLKRVTMSRVTVSLGSYILQRAIGNVSCTDHNEILRAAYAVMKENFNLRNESIDDQSRGKLARFANTCKAFSRCAAYSPIIMDADERDDRLVRSFIALASEAILAKQLEDALPPIDQQPII